MMKGFEQPLPVQVELCHLEQKENQAEQGDHLQEPRDTTQGSGGAQCRDTHGAVASGSLTAPDCG